MKPTYPTGDNNSGDDRNKGEVSQPRLSLQCHQVGEDRSEKRRRSPDRLVEGHRQEAERDVAEHHRHAEHQTESRDLKELYPGSNRLHGDHLHPCYGDVA